MFIIHIRVLPARPRDTLSLKGEALLLTDAIGTGSGKGRCEKGSFDENAHIATLGADKCMGATSRRRR